MYKRKFKKSFFLVLLIIFIVVITPLYLLCYGIFQWGYTMTTNEISQSLHSRSSFFVTTLENEIERIKKLQFECLNDEDLFYFVNASQIMTQHENNTNRLALQKRLSLMHDGSNYIENVSVWIPRVNQMISASRGVEPITDEWERILSAKADDSQAGIVFMDNEMYLCSAYPALPADQTAIPLYILATKLSTSAIKNDILSFNRYPDGGTMLSNIRQNNFILVGEDIKMAEWLLLNKYKQADYNNSDIISKDFNGEEYLVFETNSPYLNMQLHTYVSNAVIYGNLYHYRDLFIVFTIAAFILIIAYLWFANVLVNKPIKLLVKSITKVEQGELQVRIKHHSNDEFSYLYTAFNQMVSSLQNMFEINYKQQILTNEAELRQLQAQINPHFLYNSFFILYRMAKDEDYENITEFLTYLSEYYRYITRDACMEVPLSDEVNHAIQYAKIQEMRFKRRISVDFEPLPQCYEKILAPRLILQPLLENAFNHGLKDTVADGRLKIWYKQDGERLLINVDNNGTQMSKEELSNLLTKLSSFDDKIERTGIINIHHRLQLRFGPQYGLEIANLDKEGMRFTIALPLNNNRSA